jgi:hypothetical protein
MSHSLSDEQRQEFIKWVKIHMNQEGRSLSEEESEWAKLVGVKNVNEVVVVEVDEIPAPPVMLQELAEEHLDPRNANGLTLGHTILVKNGSYSRKLLQHELRHVYQVETYGLLEFLEKYVRQVMEKGYQNAGFESDAVEASLLQ